MYTTKQAVRAFNRVWNPIAAGLELQEQADAGFDGGEFSGDFHHRQYDEVFNRALECVAEKFEIPAADILDEAVRQDHLYYQDF